jgi:hypothetical protein
LSRQYALRDAIQTRKASQALAEAAGRQIHEALERFHAESFCEQQTFFESFLDRTRPIRVSSQRSIAIDVPTYSTVNSSAFSKKRGYSSAEPRHGVTCVPGARRPALFMGADFEARILANAKQRGAFKWTGAPDARMRFEAFTPYRIFFDEAHALRNNSVTNDKIEQDPRARWDAEIERFFKVKP